jgi:rhodanese-related sulfurtransferase
MSRTLQRALVVTIAGALLGLAANSVSPRRIPYCTPPPEVLPPSDYVTLDEAKGRLHLGAAFFLDARAPSDYATGHIATAFNLPAEEFDAYYGQIAGMLTTSSVIIVYCDGVECSLSHDLTKRLRQLGYANVHILKNGWTLWRGAGLPTATGAHP